VGLLYNHFPSKDAQFEAVLVDYGRELSGVMRKALEKRGPGTEALVLLTVDVIYTILFEVPGHTSDQRTFEQLFFRSLIGDTKFAQRHYQMLDKYFDDEYLDQLD
jgi:AcrR family transcriptional regulator